MEEVRHNFKTRRIAILLEVYQASPARPSGRG
jgi:hypothetical protein